MGPKRNSKTANNHTSKNRHKGRAHLDFPIVGVGASAGGLEAFERLFRLVPKDPGMGFALVQHLDPTHASHLTEILSRATRMPVTQVTDGMRVLRNHVYIIPPNTYMGLTDGALKLVPRQPIQGQFMPVDFFFRSLAESQKHRAIGVILSGTASDGAAGSKAIKAAGGVTFAQDPKTAKYIGMPQSSIAAGGVDFVLTPEGIAEELTKIGRHPYFQVVKPEEIEHPTAAPEQESEIREILALMRKSFGVDFSLYKQTTIHRRIRRRMALQSTETIKEYSHFLAAHPSELESLYKDMFISVSGFFREPDSFRRLVRLAFPSIIRNRPAKTPVRIWVPGCSTGEEAYSIAISLLEFMKRRETAPVQIFATDISEDAIQKARRGFFLESDLKAEMDSKRLQRWFVKADDGYRINKTVRDMVIFAKQDVTKDPPFSRLDMLSCRNLLIYFGPTVHKKLIPLFHYSLRPGGYLFLGSAETVGTFSDLFSLVDKTCRFYIKKETAVRPAYEYPSERYLPLHLEQREAPKEPAHPGAAESLKEATDLILLNEYAPPSVLVNDEMDILQIRGRTGDFLEPATGAPTMNLFKMAREGLLADLQSAVQEARKQNTAVVREGIFVKQNHESREISLQVLPVITPTSKERHFLVMFKETKGLPAIRLPKGLAKRQMALRGEVSDQRNMRLQRELETTKAYLESVIDKHEASNEELRSLNEEIMSSNEELQSTSEELETANEELQSANEELTTLNDELHTRNQEASRANNDILNILNSMNLTIIMLDAEMNIRRFTPSAQNVFSLIQSDIGRPIGDIRPKLNFPNPEEAIREVVETGRMLQKELQDDEGHWYSIQIRPYLTTEREVDGAVIALTDIHALVTRKAELERAMTQLRAEAAEREAAEKQLHEMQRRMLQAEISNQREAMAREFHDTLSQTLAAIVMRLEAAEDQIPGDGKALQGHLVKAKEVARDGLDRARRYAWAWRAAGFVKPGELHAALDGLGHRLLDASPIKFHFEGARDRPIIPETAANELSKIAQEALANVLRHSGATDVWVELGGQDDTGNLVVRDNGRGFNVAEARAGTGFGLLSMEERARQIGAQFTLQSQPGQGTKVEVVVPLFLKQAAGDR